VVDLRKHLRRAARARWAKATDAQKKADRESRGEVLLGAPQPGVKVSRDEATSNEKDADEVICSGRF
jgi:hypothetical protein